MKRRLANLARVALVFAIVGPLIGLVVFAAATSGVLAVSCIREGFWVGPFFLLYGWMFAHFVGVGWALLAAVVATLLAEWRSGTPVWIGPAAGVVTWGVAALAGADGVVPDGGLTDGAAIDRTAAGYAAVMAATFIGAAWLSWLVVRRWVRV